jgi:CheY-like chemotaxis protein
MKKPEKIKTDTRVREEKAGQRAKKPVTVLHVDDDPNDTTLLQVACARADVGFELQNIGDSSEVMDYLNGHGKYADRTRYQFPGLVLLDMKMPRATGLDILKWIRSHSTLKHLPVIVLSGSELQEDVKQAYEGGANSYLVKPPNFNSLVSMVKDIGAQLPALPHARPSAG